MTAQSNNNEMRKKREMATQCLYGIRRRRIWTAACMSA